jgi:hypothetical protein
VWLDPRAEPHRRAGLQLGGADAAAVNGDDREPGDRLPRGDATTSSQVVGRQAREQIGQPCKAGVPVHERGPVPLGDHRQQAVHEPPDHDAPLPGRPVDRGGGGVVAITLRSLCSRRSTSLHAADPVSRRYPTHTDVSSSSRLTRRAQRLASRPGRRPSRGPSAPIGRRGGEGWPDKAAQREVDSVLRRLRAVALHHGGDQRIIQIDVGATHTHVRGRRG